MINHITLLVRDFKRSKNFYAQALKPLGYRLLKSENNIAGFGVEDVEGRRDFWIKAGSIKKQHHSFSCLAFTASNKSMVDGFYKAAIKHGGKSNGTSGYRKKYHSGYYAAYVLDPDGNNIEVVFDDPSKMK